MTRLTENNVVYSKVKAFEGAITVVDGDGEGRFVSPEFPVFEMNDSVDPAYLRQWFASERFMTAIRSLSKGIGARRERVNPTDFLRIEVPVPSLPDQRRIAAHLDAVGSGIDLISEKSSRRTMLAEACTRSTWHQVAGPVMAIGDLLEPVRRPIEISPTGRYRPIGVRGFGRGLITYPMTPAEDLSKLRYFTLEPEALILSNIKAWEGAVCTTSPHDSGCIASNRFLQYRSRGNTSIEFVRDWLLSPDGLSALGTASPGSADRNRTLSIENFEAIGMPVPEPALQRHVVAVHQAARETVAQGRLDKILNALLPAARDEVFSQLR